MGFDLMKHRTMKGDCWEHKQPYGRIRFENKMWAVHRLSMYLFRPNEYDEKLLTLHRCNNPKCFNPAHLYMGTARDNMIDRWDFGANAGQRAERPKKNTNTLTQSIGVRLTNKQIEALKQLPTGISISILCRALLDVYLDGDVPPEIHGRILQEAERTQKAMGKGDSE